MGLYLKCPGCQTPIPLYEKGCSRCGQSLEHLPREQRVYIIGAGAAAAPPPAAPSPAKPARKAKASRKKT
jgi:hypothetical protein